MNSSSESLAITNVVSLIHLMEMDLAFEGPFEVEVEQHWLSKSPFLEFQRSVVEEHHLVLEGLQSFLVQQESIDIRGSS